MKNQNKKNVIAVGALVLALLVGVVIGSNGSTLFKGYMRFPDGKPGVSVNDCIHYKLLKDQGTLTEKGFQDEGAICGQYYAGIWNGEFSTKRDCENVALLQEKGLVSAKGLGKKLTFCMEAYTTLMKGFSTYGDCQTVAKFAEMGLLSSKGLTNENVYCSEKYPSIYDADYSGQIKNECSHFKKYKEKGLITEKGLNGEAAYCSENYPEIWN